MEPSLYFHEFIRSKNLTSIDWGKNKNLTRLLGTHRKAYDVLIMLEQESAKKLNLSNDSQCWNGEDYRAIYVNISKNIPTGKLKSRLLEMLSISINSGDARETEHRLNLFAKLLGGYTAYLEGVPNVIRHLFVIFKYIQGQPKLWDTLIRREEQ